jgi:uncharacterized protein
LNFVAVLVGASLGLAVGTRLSPELQSVALSGLGLVTIGLGLKMFLQTRQVLVVAASVAIGGVIGKALGLDHGLDQLAEWARRQTGGGLGFNDGLITASVLFCVGPMTLLGCIQDALERRIDLLSVKSLMDLVAATFLAAVSPSFGQGVLVSASVVLVVQSALTLLARPLEPVAKHPGLLAEATAAGGAILTGIGLGLLEIKRLPTVVFVPALLLAPLIASRLPASEPGPLEAG